MVGALWVVCWYKDVRHSIYGSIFWIFLLVFLTNCTSRTWKQSHIWAMAGGKDCHEMPGRKLDDLWKWYPKFAVFIKNYFLWKFLNKTKYCLSWVGIFEKFFRWNLLHVLVFRISLSKILSKFKQKIINSINKSLVNMKSWNSDKIM